jgi:predicted nucleic acid-binding protein
MIVLDASAVLELMFRTPAGLEVARRIASDAETLHAPHLIDIECLQAVRRYCRAGVVDEARARLALEDLAALDVTRYPHDAVWQRIWALRDNVTAYDAAYVALAEALRAPLLTTDARIARAPGHAARVELID